MDDPSDHVRGRWNRPTALPGVLFASLLVVLLLLLVLGWNSIEVWQLMMGVAVLAVGLLAWGVSWIRQDEEPHRTLGSTMVNGAVFTLGVILLQHAITDRQAENNLRLELALQERIIGFDASDRDLSGIYLRGKDLLTANFTGADLVGADLRYTDVEGSIFVDANLTGARLVGANLHNSDIHNANLRGADLRRAKLTDCDFTNTDVSGTRLDRAIFGSSRGEHLQLADVRSWDGARADDCTCWPNDFDPVQAGIIIEAHNPAESCDECPDGSSSRPAAP